jgi:hypothetical protein
VARRTSATASRAPARGRRSSSALASLPSDKEDKRTRDRCACAEDRHARAIAAAAKRLNELREAWLNPPDLVERVPSYPDRLLPRDEEAARELKRRTLTNLYNQRPAWLDHAHKALDAAVVAAYGWPAGLADDEVLRRLLELNQERARAGR